VRAKNQRRDEMNWILTHNERTIQITTEHPASSYDKPVVLMDGALSDAAYNPEPIQPDSMTHGPIEHVASISGYDGATEMLVTQWATKDQSIMSLGIFGACGHVLAARH